MPDDAEAVDSWLTEAMAAIAGKYAGDVPIVTLAETMRTLAPRQTLLLIGLRTSETGSASDTPPNGMLILTEQQQDLVTIDALAIAAPVRNLGYGAEAVYELEVLYPNSGLIAGVPVTNGLAIYFWLRVGYRPLFPHPITGSLGPERIWMERAAPRCVSAAS